MTEEIIETPFLMNIGFVITYKCQIACPHCVMQAGPNRKEEMKSEDVFSWITEASVYRHGQIKTACFTGGEPFYDINKLKKIFSATMSHGMIPTVVTNAFWAKSKKIAIEILSEMPELKVISISTDRYHQKEIPFERVKNALLAAKELGLVHTVAVCTEDENDPEYESLLKRLEKIIDRDKINTAITFPAGRAMKKVDSSKYQMAAEPPITACPSAHTPVIFPDGRIFACIGPIVDIPCRHSLLLGNLQEKSLAAILDDTERNMILHILRLWGPSKLFALLQKNGYEDKLPNKFVKNSICNLCYTLLSDKTLNDALIDITQDRDLMKKTAYARMYYFKETVKYI